MLVAGFPFRWETRKTPDRNEVIQCVEEETMGLVRGKTLTLMAVQLFAFIRLNNLKSQNVWIVLPSCLKSIEARILLYSKGVKILII